MNAPSRAVALGQFPTKLREAFQFLQDELGFAIARESESNMGFSIEYARGERRVALSYDFRDDFFYFKLIRGADTPYPNDQDTENFEIFEYVFQTFDPSLDRSTLQPRDHQYEQPLRLQAELLRKHCTEVLKGESWITTPRLPRREIEVVAPPRKPVVPRRLWPVLWVLLVLATAAGQRMCSASSRGESTPGASQPAE